MGWNDYRKPENAANVRRSRVNNEMPQKETVCSEDNCRACGKTIIAPPWVVYCDNHWDQQQAKLGKEGQAGRPKKLRRLF